METIKYFAVITAFATILGLVVHVQAGPGLSRLAGTVDKALLRAALIGNLDDAMKAVGAGANVNAVNQYGQTPLLLASHKGHTGIVEALLNAKAEVDKASKWGGTPLLQASREGHTDVVKILVFNGATPSGRESIAMKAIIDQAQEARRTVGNQDWLLEDVPLSEFLPKVLASVVEGYIGIDLLAGVHDEQLRRLMREQVVKNRTERRAQESAAAAQRLESAQEKNRQ